MENKDIEYFDKLWQDSKPKDGMVHNKETWDRMANNWGADSPKVRLKKDEKVEKIISYLEEQGALCEDYDVLDLGCGPGKYGIGFANKAKSVTLSDVSTVMLGYAKTNVEKAGVTNVGYEEADFLTQSVSSLGWEKKFDLVFTSLTPAMDSRESIEKINACTKKWAFNNSFVFLKDSLKDEVKQNVFGMETDSNFGNSSPYCIWNILWLLGLHPQITYYTDELDYEYPVTKESAFETVENIIRDRAPTDEEVERTLEYFKKTYGDGPVKRHTTSMYSWILWKVD